MKFETFGKKEMESINNQDVRIFDRIFFLSLPMGSSLYRVYVISGSDTLTSSFHGWFDDTCIFFLPNHWFCYFCMSIT